MLYRHLGALTCIIPMGSRGQGLVRDTEGNICLHPGKNQPEEQDEVSCLVSSLARTAIGHQAVRPEVRCSCGQCSPDSLPP